MTVNFPRERLNWFFEPTRATWGGFDDIAKLRVAVRSPAEYFARGSQGKRVILAKSNSDNGMRKLGDTL
jgi:hypothetical protein